MNKRAAMQLCLTILLPLALTGCGQKSVRVVPPPVELTRCADEPVAPELPGKERQDERDRLTLDYVLGLRAAWGDCRAKVDGVRAWSSAVAQ